MTLWPELVADMGWRMIYCLLVAVVAVFLFALAMDLRLIFGPLTDAQKQAYGKHLPPHLRP